MSTLGVILLLLALAAVAAGPVRWWVNAARHKRARLLEGTARLHAIGAEEQRMEAIRAEREATSEAEARRAAEAREEAERELEAAGREGRAARALDPELEAEPDPNLPRFG